MQAETLLPLPPRLLAIPIHPCEQALTSLLPQYTAPKEPGRGHHTSTPLPSPHMAGEEECDCYDSTDLHDALSRDARSELVSRSAGARRRETAVDLYTSIEDAGGSEGEQAAGNSPDLADLDISPPLDHGGSLSSQDTRPRGVSTSLSAPPPVRYLSDTTQAPTPQTQERLRQQQRLETYPDRGCRCERGWARGQELSALPAHRTSAWSGPGPQR